jgi:hypothetical protein
MHLCYIFNGQVCALFQGRLAEKRLRLHVTKPGADEMAVRGDSNRLRQVLSLTLMKDLEVFLVFHHYRAVNLNDFWF